MVRDGPSANNSDTHIFTDSEITVLRQAASIQGISLPNLLAAVRAFQSGLNLAPVGGNILGESAVQDCSHLDQEQASFTDRLPGQDLSDSNAVRQSHRLLSNLNDRLGDGSNRVQHEPTIVGEGEPRLPPRNDGFVNNVGLSDDIEFMTAFQAADTNELFSAPAIDQLPPLSDSDLGLMNENEFPFSDSSFHWPGIGGILLSADGTAADSTVGSSDTSITISPPQPVPLLRPSSPIYTTEAISQDSSSVSRGRHANYNTSRKRKRNPSGAENRQGRRGPFQDPDQRLATARTRKLGACIRCQMQRIRCVPDQADPHGACQTCLMVMGPTLCKLPCLRYKMSEIRLLDHAECPRANWTKRWHKMALDDIKEWRSSTTKVISLTQDVSGLFINLRVKEFVPQEGDALAREWVTEGVRHSYACAPYAIADMSEASEDYKRFIHTNLSKTIRYYTDKTDVLIKDTYEMAYRHSQFAAQEEERVLLHSVLLLWMGSRMETRSDRICSEETLGMMPRNYGPDRLNTGIILVPPVITAQVEIIITATVLIPMAKVVLQGLQKLVQSNRPRSWFTIYLTAFILLHSCSLMTAHDNKKARKQGFKQRFFRTHLVEELHKGAQVLLAHFHYCNKGSHPFTLDWNDPRNVRRAELDAEQVEFMQQTAKQLEAKAAIFRSIREQKRYEHDLYFLSQLYDFDWKPESHT